MKIRTSLLALVVIATAGTASAATFNVTGPSAGSVDISGPTGTVSQVTATGAGDITDLNVIVHLFNNSRTFATFPNTMAWGDLTVTLEKDGVVVPLWFAGNPGETTDLFVAFDDESTEGETLNDVLDTAGPQAFTTAPTSFTSGVFSTTAPGDVSASYEAAGSLSDFDGIQLAGVWSLRIIDDIVPNEGDSLLGWQIYGETDAPGGVSNVPLPAGFGFLLFGIGAFGAMRLRQRDAA